ncbi:hypothetical protein JCM8097_006764 [Rhodosporidiobolus ruineniae]
MATTTDSPRTLDLEKASSHTGSGTHDGANSTTDKGQPNAYVEKSRGVRQMEALSERLNTKYRILLYGSFAVLAYVMSLDQYTNRNYLTAATSVSFNAHSTLTTISSIKAVFQAVSQPPIAKISDVAGRIEAYSLCVFLYALGYIVVASSQSIYAYAAGNSINILGITGLFLLQNIIIADISSLRNRLFWSIFPSLPGTINVWVSGDIAQSLLGAHQETANMWRWGIGMFCILTPALATPVMLTLGIGMRKHKKLEAARAEEKLARPADWRKKSLRENTVSVFWKLDIIGLLLLVGGFGMLLTIITIANGKGSHWNDAHSIALLTVGGILCITWAVWERYGAKYPIVPFGLLRNRTVIVCFVIAVLHPVAGGVIGSYFYTYLQVAGNETTKSASRITSLASFTGTWSAFVMGMVVRQIRYLKPIIIFGFCIEVLAFGLMIRYRNSGATQGDLAAVQVVRGIAVGCIGFPVQAAIQSVTKRTNLASITAGYLTIYYLAGGVGSAIGGGIWSNTVPGKMNQYISNSTIAAAAYSNPVKLISQYAPGTEIRDAMARAHGETQRILSITGCVIAACGLIAACCLQSVKLTDEVTLEKVEQAPDGKLTQAAN